MSREVEDKAISVDQTDFERVPVENSLRPYDRGNLLPSDLLSLMNKTNQNWIR